MLSGTLTGLSMGNGMLEQEPVKVSGLVGEFTWMEHERLPVWLAESVTASVKGKNPDARD
jgi:hypothetical protein